MVHLHEKVATSERTRMVTYREINHELVVHPLYDSTTIPETARISFSRMRLSSHYLRIETGGGAAFHVTLVSAFVVKSKTKLTLCWTAQKLKHWGETTSLWTIALYITSCPAQTTTRLPALCMKFYLKWREIIKLFECSCVKAQLDNVNIIIMIKRQCDDMTFKCDNENLNAIIWLLYDNMTFNAIIWLLCDNMAFNAIWNLIW